MPHHWLITTLSNKAFVPSTNALPPPNKAILSAINARLQQTKPFCLPPVSHPPNTQSHYVCRQCPTHLTLKAIMSAVSVPPT